MDEPRSLSRSLLQHLVEVVGLRECDWMNTEPDGLGGGAVMTRLVRAVRGVPFVLIGTLAGAGCAVMPPTQPAADLAQIVGTWEGTLVTLVYPAARTFAITTTIHADGTFESIVAGAPDVGPNFPGPTVSGTVYVADGAFRYHWPGNNRDGTFILHEHGQWRVLEQVTDDRTSRARMTPKT